VYKRLHGVALLLILGIALLVFEPKKLPELGKGTGDGIRGFRSATKEHAYCLESEVRNSEVDGAETTTKDGR
jgi:sec-independent protein translocase protein TatA